MARIRRQQARHRGVRRKRSRHNPKHAPSLRGLGGRREEPSGEEPKGDVEEEKDAREGDGGFGSGEEEEERDDAPCDDIEAEGRVELGSVLTVCVCGLLVYISTRSLGWAMGEV